jgi:DNA-binding transcriptional ArsR family regulator
MLELFEQSSGTTHRIGVAGHTLRAAVLPLSHQPGTLQHGHVFLHSGKRHVVVRGEFAHGRVGIHDPRQNVAPRGISERPEQLVQNVRRWLSIYNHLVVDSSTPCVVRSQPRYQRAESPGKVRQRRSKIGSVDLHRTGHQLATYRTAHAPPIRAILNHMVQYAWTGFDASFAALSDVTRRGVLEQLGRADASITDLAEKFHMTLTGMKKHVGVLEQAGLVTTEKVGRVRTCKLGLRRLEEEAAWIERYRQLWDARFDELDKVVEELKRKEKVDGRKKRK